MLTSVFAEVIRVISVFGLLVIPPEAKPLLDLINTAVQWGTAFGGGICALMLVGAGINYQTAGGNPQKREGAKDAVKGALVGLVICLFAWTLTTMVLNAVTPGAPPAGTSLPNIHTMASVVSAFRF